MSDFQLIGHTILKLSAVASTNSYALDLLKNQKTPDGLIVYAIEQTEGRGQRGTIWHSNPSDSLTMSVIITPKNISLLNQFSISMMVANALFGYFQSQTPEKVIIKWPNDIRVLHKKIAGVLIENTTHETTIKNAVIGIGINLNHTHFPDELNAISLHQITSQYYELETELKKIAEFLNTEYLKLLQQKENYFIQNKLRYLENTLGYLSPTPIKWNNENRNVQIIDIDISGKILIELENKNTHWIDLKEIVFL